jgi:hypothetical protein
MIDIWTLSSLLLLKIPALISVWGNGNHAITLQKVLKGMEVL